MKEILVCRIGFDVCYYILKFKFSHVMTQGSKFSIRWKNNRPVSADGNYRPLAKTRQQNISMQRQENLRWVSELSYIEEKEQWQEQINQLKKQLDFSVNICQTLMQDQQVSCIFEMYSFNLQSFEAVHIFFKTLVNCWQNFLPTDFILFAANSSNRSLQRYAKQCGISSGTPYNAPAEPVLHTTNVATE